MNTETKKVTELTVTQELDVHFKLIDGEWEIVGGEWQDVFFNDWDNEEYEPTYEEMEEILTKVRAHKLLN